MQSIPLNWNKAIKVKNKDFIILIQQRGHAVMSDVFM